MTPTVELFALFSIILQAFFVFLNLLGLPGNIAALIIPLIWALTGFLEWNSFLIILVIIGTGEVVELVASYFVGKKYGVSNASFIASIIGSLIGGIFGAGVLLGIGAIPGTFLGAFLGTYIYEFIKYSDNQIALRRGFATFVGRFVGSAMKIILGIVAIVETWKALSGY